ncbi:hypothetical protein CMK11_13485 [Candidatus Poribacteria bacterium]|nr:hypothetical protein [Candidatus Poribacteria bacterium]
MSDFIQSLDARWSAYLGCQPEQLRDGRRHVIARPEWRSEERLPWPLTRGSVCLFTTGTGWVLSVPHEQVARAGRLCGDHSFEELIAEGDRISQDWFDRLGAEDECERPGPDAYRIMSELVGPEPLRGWSHYVFSYADPSSWTQEVAGEVARIAEDDPDIWAQWQAWPGAFCSPKFTANLEVTDAFGYVRDGRLVSVGQIQAHHAEYAWEFGVDTLPEFRGRGYATAVLRSVTAHIIGRGHVPYHYADAYNRASLRLPAKLGYHRYAEGFFAHSQ